MYSSVKHCIKSLYGGKSESEIEGKMKHLCNKFLPQLEKEYKLRQYFSTYQINFTNLQKEAKQIVKKEMFIINLESQYLKKSETWFKNLKDKQKYVKILVQHLSLSHSHLLSIKLEQHKINISEARVEYFKNCLIKFFEPKKDDELEEYTKKIIKLN